MLKLHPSYPSHWNLGVALAGERRLEDAIGTFRAGLTVAPNDPHLKAYLAWASAVAGRREQAVSIVEELQKQRDVHRPLRTYDLRSRIDSGGATALSDFFAKRGGTERKAITVPWHGCCSSVSWSAAHPASDIRKANPRFGPSVSRHPRGDSADLIEGHRIADVVEDCAGVRVGRRLLGMP